MSIDIVAETIRDRIQLRKRRVLVTAAIGVAVSIIGLACGFAGIGGSRFPLGLLAALGVVIIFGAMLYLDLTKCPKCLGRVGPVLYTRDTNYCPQCGVSLDIPA